jgi:hypothetical protein
MHGSGCSLGPGAEGQGGATASAAGRGSSRRCSRTQLRLGAQLANGAGKRAFTNFTLLF